MLNKVGQPLFAHPGCGGGQGTRALLTALLVLSRWDDQCFELGTVAPWVKLRLGSAGHRPVHIL